MAQLYYDPKGAEVTIGSHSAGQASSASLSLTAKRSNSRWEWDTAACRAIEEVGEIYGMEGALSLEMMSAADLDLMAIALFGSEAGSVVNIGDTTTEEFEVNIVVQNKVEDCTTYTYNFPRCRLADSQEHVFGVAADVQDPTFQTIEFVVMLAAGSDTLGTITKA